MTTWATCGRTAWPARDARIDFLLPGDGLYVIMAGRFGGRGDYVLSVDLLAP